MTEQFPNPKHLGLEIKKLIRLAMKIKRMHENEKHDGKECDC